MLLGYHLVQDNNVTPHVLFGFSHEVGVDGWWTSSFGGLHGVLVGSTSPGLAHHFVGSPTDQRVIISSEDLAHIFQEVQHPGYLT